MVIRKAFNAGSWYEGSEKGLRKSIEGYFLDKEFGPGKLPKSSTQEKRTIIGAISPHAGYRYSACCSAFTYLKLFEESPPDTVIILGTNHTGYRNYAIMEEGEWETPLGNLKVDNELAGAILTKSNTIISDTDAFIKFSPIRQEWNIELQLPFIKYCAGEKNVKIVPIKYSTRDDFNALDVISTEISNAITSVDKDIVIVASSDLTHKQPRDYKNPEKDLKDMSERDHAVIDAFKEFNPELTYNAALRTSVCGPQTITSLMLICKKLDANKCIDLKYYTSYQKLGGSGPCDISVGYFSGIIVKN